MDKKPSGQNRKAMVLSASVSACSRHTEKGLKTGAMLSHDPPRFIYRNEMAFYKKCLRSSSPGTALK